MDVPPERGIDDRAPLAEVAGKVAFITGGSSGIGLGIARAASAAGMRVAFSYLTDRHRDDALRQLGDDHAGVVALKLDVSQRDAFTRAADAVEAAFGNVHLLALNAGVGVRTPLSAASYDDWDWAMSVNVGGVFNGIRTLLPRMLVHGEGGHIVGTASMSGLMVGARSGVYTTTKFAVVGMLEALRGELRDQPIGVSVFCPGLVATAIAQSDRNRPGAAPADPTGPTGTPRGMDPLEAGQRVLRGVRANHLYILSHSEFAPGLRERSDAIMASIPDEPAPAERVVAGARVLSNPIYPEERDRRRPRPK